MKSAIFFCFVLLFFCAGCRTVPVTERYQLLLTTSVYENELGEEAYEQYLDEYPVSKNQEYNQALARCGKALQEAAGQSDFEWKFTVLESSIQNAFCLPGGKVAVYTGLLDLMNTEAELAFVVGHEIGHAIARHSGERMSWGFLQSLGGILVDIGFQNDFLNEIYGTGTELGVMLPFSRSNESEADRIGLLLMAKAGYSPAAAAEFWSRFTKGNKTDSLSVLFSTHPCDSQRIADMKKHIPEAEQLYRKSASPKGSGIIFQRKK